MDMEHWTEIKVVHCPKVGSRVATGIGMTGLCNHQPGPEFTDVYGTLDHCIGAVECGLALPATISDMTRSRCPIGKLLEETLSVYPSPPLAAVGE